MFTIHGFIIAISINNTLKVNLYTLLLYITFYTFISEREDDNVDRAGEPNFIGRCTGQ